MKVYALTENTGYARADVVAIYATQELANAAREILLDTKHGKTKKTRKHAEDFVWIEEWEVIKST